MKARTHETSPQVYARIAAILYLVVIAAGITAQMIIGGRLIVDGDAAATANNILAQKGLFQLGFTFYMIEMTCQTALAALFYILLKPVNRNIALLGLAFFLVGCTIKTLSRLFYLAPLLVLGSSDFYLTVFSTEQLQSLALLLLKVNDLAAGMALAFFGVSTFLNGYLIFHSAFLPRILGVISMVAGVGWFTFIYPSLGNQLFMVTLLFGLIGSMSLIIWLLARGVNIEKWNEASRLESVAA